MKTLIQTITIVAAVTAATSVPALAQEAASDVGGRLGALTCSEFLTLGAEDQTTLMLALRAHVNGEPLPDEPLPIGTGGPAAAGAAGGAAAAGGEGSEGTDPPDDTGVVDAENESGKVNPDGTEASVTDAPGDPKLTAMRTSCEGGPASLAADALRAAHADNE